MLLSKLCTGEEIHRYQKSIVVNFTGMRRVLSTSPNNGGFREDLTAVFNNDGTIGAGMASTLRAPTYGEHMALVSEELGLDPDTSAGISTAAQMENVSIKTESYKDITVTAIVTGGVEVNGGRVGDEASWDELEKKPVEKPHLGTINIMLFINTDLTPGALIRSLVTCTEAKTAALQELMAPSRYSRGLATGSGTDSTTIVANAESPITLEYAGKHCKLGELIGKSVKEAVKEALYLQTDLCPERQRDVLRRVDRFGITTQSLWQRMGENELADYRKDRFAMCLETYFREERLVSLVSLYAHMIDQTAWDLITTEEAEGLASFLLGAMMIPDLSDIKLKSGDKTEMIDAMIEALHNGLASLLKQHWKDKVINE